MRRSQPARAAASKKPGPMASEAPKARLRRTKATKETSAPFDAGYGGMALVEQSQPGLPEPIPASLLLVPAPMRSKQLPAKHQVAVKLKDSDIPTMGNARAGVVHDEQVTAV
jgi:hypothetical protein